MDDRLRCSRPFWQCFRRGRAQRAAVRRLGIRMPSVHETIWRRSRTWLAWESPESMALGELPIGTATVRLPQGDRAPPYRRIGRRRSR
jgi:hypothetical protein